MSIEPQKTIFIPQAHHYRQLTRTAPFILRETASGFELSERHLQCLWYDPSIRPKQLVTNTGETVRILDPGRWNLEAGPDFIDAVIQVGPDQRHLKGDIEIHIHPADWEAHRHANNPDYNQVIAHVTYFPPDHRPKGLPTPAVEIALQNPIDTTSGLYLEDIDTTAYPYGPSQSPCPCATILAELPARSRMELLESAGAYRLEKKANNFIAMHRTHSLETIAYRETMAALGYKQNTVVCRKLAALVPLARIRKLPPLEAYACLTGSAGLLPNAPSPRWTQEAQVFIRKVWDQWWPIQRSHQALSPKTWTLSGLRPQNHPLRRMAAAASCFSASAQDLIPQINQIAQELTPWVHVSDIFKPAEPLQFWTFHLSLASPRKERPIALIGEARLAAWWNNIAVPLLAAQDHDPSELTKKLKPEQINSHMREAAHRLFGFDHNPKSYRKNGLRQQGLLQIFHDCCLKECHDCSLHQNLRQTAGQSS